MKNFRPNEFAVAVTEIVIGDVPAKSITTCCPELTPHNVGTFVAPPVTVIMSVLQIPSPLGDARVKSKNSTRN